MIDILAAFAHVKPQAEGWTAKCPAHDDQRNSLSIGQGRDGRWLLKCHAGCPIEAILAAVHLDARDLFPKTNANRKDRTSGARGRTIVATYPYHDERGVLLYEVIRFAPKDFRQRAPDGAWTIRGIRRVLYRLPELRGQGTVYVTEGERDADRLWALGLAATTNAGGAGKWRPEFSALLKTAGCHHVIVLPDHDAPGEDHGREVAQRCADAGLAVTLIPLPGLPRKGDVSDFLDTHSKDDLLALVREAPPFTPHPPTPTASTLSGTIDVFRRWLYLKDPAAVYAVAATLVANRAPGDPVWLLLVCAPSTGKTEILSAATRLPWVIPAAKVTEASLLSGTSKRERVTGATGGLLRQVGDFGVLLCKDFTSVLAQNKDARAEAMAALREVYDGTWDRPVGTDGGRVLSWHGKCGLLGGVTPALDQYGQVLSALGDRFVLLRLPDADVTHFGEAALRHGDHERQMRHELRQALAGLVEHADTTAVNRPLSPVEQSDLIKLAAYTATARTAVVRDGYHQDVMFLPQVEGPGRLVKAYARLLGGLEAIGCEPVTAWMTLRRIAIDCAPALRTRVIKVLIARPAPVRTADIAAAIEVVTKTASRYLEDLSILRMAERHKQGGASNAPDYWSASPWLREHWPESRTEKYPPPHQTPIRQDEGGPPDEATSQDPSTKGGTSQSHDPVEADDEIVF